MPALVAAVGVLVVQLAVIRAVGTDIPFHDQWDAEGRGLYPALVDGAAGWAQAFLPHNEHRIVWTQALNGGLFRWNGQWDPLVQQVVGAGLHAGASGLLVATLVRGLTGARRWWVTAVVALAAMPIAAWHNAVWGFQTQVYFVILFSVLACAGWSASNSLYRLLGATAAMGAGMLAMGAGLVLPVALALGIGWGARRERVWRGAVVAAGFALVALVSREVTAHAALRAGGVGEFVIAALRLLAWPLPEQPWAALAFNLPLLVWAGWRLSRRLAPVPGERAVVLLALWAIGVCLTLAWSRGGGAELAAGVPSRYVDFVALLPAVNAWAALVLYGQLTRPWRALVGLGAAVWLLAWIGASATAWRGVLYPRAVDRDAPVRLMREFQETGDAAIFEGQPRLLVPHPNLSSVQAVLGDPRLAGRLPPSLQPGRPQGPLSRAMRWLLGRAEDSEASTPH